MQKASAITSLRSAARKPSTMLPLLLCAALLTLGALFFVWQRYQFVRLSFTVEMLRERKAALQDAIEPLEIEVDYLSRPERLEDLATRTLGLRIPTAKQLRKGWP